MNSPPDGRSARAAGVSAPTAANVQWKVRSVASSAAAANVKLETVTKEPSAGVPVTTRFDGASVSSVQRTVFVTEALPASSVAYTLTSYSPSSSAAPVNSPPDGRSSHFAAVSAPTAANVQWKVSSVASSATAANVKLEAFTTEPSAGVPTATRSDGAVRSTTHLRVTAAQELPAASVA